MSENHRRMPRPEWEWTRAQILSRDGRRCRQCGKAGRLEVHHVKHLQDGGTNSPENLTTLCRDCHIRAHARPVSAATSAWRDFVSELK